MKATAADRRRLTALTAAYAGLVALAFLSYTTSYVHVGALAVIPILFIAYYLRPATALATAFVSGVLLGFLDEQAVVRAHALGVPPIFDALILSLSLSTVVVVANRLRETRIANELLRGSLVKAWQAAEFDSLTGMANRAYFVRTLEEAAAESGAPSRAAVLFCDLDGFKRVNDTYGHLVGDKVLCLAAARLANTVRAVDIAARLGGDEFAVLLRPLHDADEAEHMAANIERAFRDPFHSENQRYDIGITVGISILPDDGTAAETLLRVADARMYRAKERKRAARG